MEKVSSRVIGTSFGKQVSPEPFSFPCRSWYIQNLPASLPTVNRFVTEMVHACGADSSLADAVIRSMIERSVSPRFEVLIDEFEEDARSSAHGRKDLQFERLQQHP